MKIAIDAMGGDFAPSAIIQGVKLGYQDYPDVDMVLVGPRDILEKELHSVGLSPDDARLEIVEATQVVEMDEPSAVALRQKKNSSITVSANLLKDGIVEGIVSAGHTGAAVASTVVKCRMLPGIDRPGIAAVFPAPPGRFVLLDVGANVDCKPRHLAQYAILGERYADLVLGIRQPRVGILSVGEEDGKGNDLTKQAHKMMKELPINFIGNVEGHEMFANEVDVVVCDGFVGNAVLKCCESLAKAMFGLLKSNLMKTPMRKAGAFLSKNAFLELKELTDHEEYGGAPLLGINGNCIIAHGSSSPKSIRNAIRVCREMVSQRLNERILSKIQDVDWQAIEPKEDV